MQRLSNQMRVMESGNHFKNGASLKSLMSKGNFKLFAILAIITGLFTFISCDKEDEEIIKSLSVATASMNFSAVGYDASIGGIGGYQTTMINTNYIAAGALSISSSASWCTTARSNYMLTVYVEKNTSTNPRQATVTISGEGLQTTINVSQAGATNSGGGGDSGNTTLPATPTNVTATAQSSSSINISWSAVTGATGYYIYRSTSASGTYSNVGVSSSTSYTNSDLMANTTYHYRVSAYNSAGESSQSSSTSATTQSSGGSGGGDTTTPSAPTGLTATQSGNGFLVSWNVVAGAVSYRVYYKRPAPYDIESFINVSTTSTTIEFSTQFPGTWTFWVVAVSNNFTYSTPSSQITRTFTSGGGGGGGSTNYAPCPVSNPSASGTSSITVSWSAATGNTCGTPTSYEVYKRNPNTSQFELKTTTTSRNYTENSSTVHPGLNRYAIIAINSYGKSSENHVTSSSVPLSTPTGFTASKSGTNVSFSWTRVAAATGYQIFESTTINGTYYILDQIDDNKTSHTRYYPASGTTRYFKIKAIWSTTYGGSRIDSDLSTYRSVTF